jgi:sulfur-carrier protein adenylyltransferase/sulfurtransferase
MGSDRIKELMPDELRELLARTREKRYALIDVRQPEEYAVAHIPGATLRPLMELEEHLFDLPADRELIFYCSAGPRSAIAASLAAEAELSDLPIYNLMGGMLAWDGQKIADFPRVQVFDHDRSLPDMLMTAMDLEKGAYRYYRAILERFGSLPFGSLIEHLSRAEEAHARMIYALWQPDQDGPPPFETLFDDLPGDIIEGGATLEEALDHLRALPSDNGIHILELSLSIEYRAYDLYRSLAERTADAPTRDDLLTIAQAEKSHMRQLQQALADSVKPAP